MSSKRLTQSQIDIIDQSFPLADDSLFDDEMASSALSDNTTKAYRSDLKHFFLWGGEIPSEVDDLVYYLEHYAGQCSTTTLKRRLVAIKQAHLSLSYDHLVDHSKVVRTFQGITRRYRSEKKKAKPLLFDDVLLILRHLDGSVSGIRDKAIILIGISLFLRRSEICNLKVSDIKRLKDRYIITIRDGKTDKHRQGVDLPIPKIDGPACPCHALDHWLQVSSIQSGYLFRRVYKGGNVNKQDLPISTTSISSMIKDHCRRAGIDEFESFSGHSFRRGGITESYSNHVPESDINFISRHKSIEQLRSYRDHSTVLHGNMASFQILTQLNAALSTN